MDWEDEDEKTTVFDRSDEDSAKALLHSVAAAVPRAKSAPPPPPPTPVSQAAAPPPPPTPPTSSAAAAPAISAAAALARPSIPQPIVPSVPAQPPAISAPAYAPSAPAYAPSAPAPQQSAPVYSAPASAPVASQAPMQSAPMYSQPYAPPTASSNKWIFVGVGVLAVAAAGYFFTRQPSEGSLVVTVAGPGGRAVSGVSVKVGNEVKCQTTPCVIEGLPAGKSQVIVVSAPGYAEAAGQAVKVVGGEETPVNVQLAAQSAGTGVKVSSATPGLRLSVDGKDYGPLPQEITDLKPGSHTIEVGGNPQFAPFTKKVDVPADQIVEVQPTLTFLKGEITVELGENAKGAKIWLKGDGEDKALHRLSLPQRISIPADKQMTLVAERKGFETYERTISLSAAEPSKTFVVSLSKPGAAEPPAAASTPKPTGSSSSSTSTSASTSASASSATPAGGAKLNINSIPMSNVILDGKPLGATPRMGVAVSAGNHTVVFVHPEHGRKVQQVNVAAGQTGTAVVRFP